MNFGNGLLAVLNPYVVMVFALLCVLASAMVAGNNLPPWGLSWWCVPALIAVGLSPFVAVIWLLNAMTRPT